MKPMPKSSRREPNASVASWKWKSSDSIKKNGLKRQTSKSKGRSRAKQTRSAPTFTKCASGAKKTIDRNPCRPPHYGYARYTKNPRHPRSQRGAAGKQKNTPSRSIPGETEEREKQPRTGPCRSGRNRSPLSLQHAGKRLHILIPSTGGSSYEHRSR